MVVIVALLLLNTVSNALMIITRTESHTLALWEDLFNGLYLITRVPVHPHTSP